MRLLCALVCHNRVEYSVKAIESWIATAGPEDHLVVFDNASTDRTREMLEGVVARDSATVILWPTNLFPGAATNRAWHEGLKLGEFDLLQRSDNDIEYLPGWRQEVEHAFTRIPELSMLGLLNRHEDYDDKQPVTEDRGVNVHWDQVGGNCVIRRSVWDAGERWIPGRWAPGGQDEDSVMAAQIRERHGLVATVIPTVANNVSFHRYSDFPEYYNRTAALRGLVPELSV